MRKIVFLLTIIVILPLFSVISHAEEEVDKYISEFENIIPEGVLGSEFDPSRLEDALGIEQVFHTLFSVIGDRGGEVLRFFLILVGGLLLLGCAAPPMGKLGETVTAGVGTVVSVLIFSVVSGIYAAVYDTIRQIFDFFLSLVPIVVGVTALGGGAFAAGVGGGGMYVTCALFSRLCGGFFYSISGFGLAMALISPYGGEPAATVCAVVKNLYTRLLGIVTLIIGGALSLQTVVASARDSAAMRVAKYAASGMIPVVGSTVSGALSTLAAGLSYAKGIIGGGGVFVIISLALSPLVLILLYRLALSTAAQTAELFGITSAQRIFSAYVFSMDTVVAAYSLSVVICVFELILFIKSGTPIG